MLNSPMLWNIVKIYIKYLLSSILIYKFTQPDYVGEAFLIIFGLHTLFIVNNYSIILQIIKICKVICGVIYNLNRKPKDTLLINSPLKSAVISYIFNGNEYKLIIPYYTNLIPKMTNTKIYINTPEGKKEFNQPPGIPILVSPDMIGASSYETFDLIEDDYTAYESGKIPTF